MHVVVVGGGPGGSVAARSLAQKGIRVTLCEFHRFPRPRPGESLPPAIEPLLGQLGLREQLLGANFPRTAGVQVQWNGPPTRRDAGSDGRGPWRNFQADRGRFDWMLLQSAAAAGVEVREATPVTELIGSGVEVQGVKIGREELKADLVIDAAGGSHWLARKLGLDLKTRSRRILVRYGYCRWGRELAEPVLKSDGAGWTWLAPLRDGRIAWVRLRWDGALETPHWLPPELDRAEPIGPSRGADVTWRKVAAAAGPGYFCVGDAAFVVDPISSHGVLRAIMSGIYAAHLIGRGQEGIPAQRVALEYNQWIAGWFEHEVSNLQALYTEIGRDFLPETVPEPLSAGANS